MKREELAAFLRARCRGRENAMKAEDLKAATHTDASLLREQVNALRREGVPIASGKEGYFYAETAGDMYSVGFGLADHYRLHELALSAQGYVMISYNDCPFIRELYKEFFIFRVLRPNSMSQKEGSEFAELIITNYDPRLFHTQLSMFVGQEDDIGYELIHEPEKALIQ